MYNSQTADPDRFLAWLRDPQRPPRPGSATGADWARLVGDVLAYAERGRERAATDASAEVACRPGCAWCCYLPVTTTGVEVRFAWDHACREHAPEVVTAIGERAAVDPAGVPQPCPFLIDDRCSVYPARPLACRAWNSIDESACRRGYALGFERTRIPAHTRLRSVYANAGQALARGLRERGVEATIALRWELARLVAGEHESRSRGAHRKVRSIRSTPAP